MAVPTILPTEATPVEVARKRKHSQTIDLTGAHEDGLVATDRRRSASANLQNRESEVANGNASNGHHEVAEPHDHEHDEDGSDSEHEMAESVVEAVVDAIESNQYIVQEDGPLTKEQAAGLRARLRLVGPHQFFEEALNGQGMNPKILGTAFGIDPHFDAGDEHTYLRILGNVIVRFFSKRTKLPQYNTIDDAAALLQRSHNILVITGAGISTSLGIPDFRSRGTGFYERIKDMGYDDPEDVFNIEYFDADPRIFYSLAGDILPDQKKFSPTHAFIRLLQDKDRLQTNYTQNIDNLEELAGIDEARIIQCHGSFAMATCRKCKHKVKGTEIFDDIRAKRVAECKRCIEEIKRIAAQPKPQKKKTSKSYDEDDENEDDNIPQPGIMKPDITFFGEQLPTTFFDRFIDRDAKQADLVIVIGTSLKVAPVSEMPNHLPHEVPHIYISREPIRHVEFDIQLLGNCDDVVFELCRRAGWNLTHEMIPKGLKLEVAKAVEETPHLWTVRRSGGETQETAVDQEKAPLSMPGSSHTPGAQ